MDLLIKKMKLWTEWKRCVFCNRVSVERKSGMSEWMNEWMNERKQWNDATGGMQLSPQYLVQ